MLNDPENGLFSKQELSKLNINKLAYEFQKPNEITSTDD